MAKNFYSKVHLDLIGKGMAFPLSVDVNGRATILDGEELVRASINTILVWTFGERFFLPEFGSRIKLLLEEPNDAMLESLLQATVPDVLAQWEPRIQLREITTEREEQGLVMKMKYYLTSTNSEQSFVFPLYQNIIY